ncbi:hypothetical protein C8N46_10555 [Kordia periserrulae]|uniref:Uncharacterized protein n=1 Tax=Kordia periserrulae TaxID=701523 RepID=A0A2T6BXU3_9FLAO|nr:hypothetical protein [Kordia periserrulae]PTX60899.1 hypothetical protein C8N46_10555 [Kordia periserrulae]
MLKNPVILSLLVILVCISCTTDKNSKRALEGTWIASYSQTANNVKNNFKDIPDYIHLMDFNGDSVRLKSFNDKNSRSYIDTIVNFSLTDGAIKLGDEEEMQIAIATDSIMLSSEVHNQRYQDVFRKLPKNPKIVNWNPIGKHYTTYHDDTQVFIDFANDSVMYSFNDATGIYSKSLWRVESIDNRTILVQKNDDIFSLTYGVVDSLIDNKLYITDYLFQEKSIVYEEVNKAYKKPSSLYGTWKLAYKEKLPLDSEQITLPSSLDSFEKLRISKDSFYFVGEPITWRYNWKYYENAETIVLEKAKKAIKVSKVTKDSLVLKMDLSQIDFLSREYIFIRE